MNIHHIYAQVSVDFGISGAGKKYYRPYGYGSTLDAVTLGLSLEKGVLKHTSLRAVGRFASLLLQVKKPITAKTTCNFPLSPLVSNSSLDIDLQKGGHEVTPFIFFWRYFL